MKRAAWLSATALVTGLMGIGTALGVRAPLSAPAAAALGDERRCAGYGGLPPEWRQDDHAGMVRLDGGVVRLGADNGYTEERPSREVAVDGFWIDRTEVTQAQFAAFVAATGYVTDAERAGEAVVFEAPRLDEAVESGSWWRLMRGANWRHPEGPQRDIPGLAREPVVQVTRADAVAYAAWLGRRLPTEAEWEYAAKAGGRGEQIERGPRDARGRPTANFWQGFFPSIDSAEDGHLGRAPVGCFAANGFGLHDLIGNVWEWTADPWSGSHQEHGADLTTVRRGRGAQGVIKGGSFLCASDFCVRYRASARHPQALDLPASHIGFRTVASR